MVRRNDRVVSPKPFFAWTGAGLFLACFLLYLPTLHAQFVYDDWWTLVRNPAIRLLHVGRFFLDPTTAADPSSGLASDFYRPVTTLTFALDYHFWQLRAAPYHLENILLFLFNGFLFNRLLKRLFKRADAALAGTAVFLFHPVQVETVAWITQRSNLLAGLGLLGSLLCFLQERDVSAFWWIGGLWLYALALLCKESSIVFPLLLFLCELASQKNGNPSGSVKQRRQLYGSLFLLSVFYLLLRRLMLNQWSQFGNASTMGLENMAYGIMAFPAYIGKLLLPLRLRPSYQYPAFTLGPILWSSAMVIAYVAMLAFLARSYFWVRWSMSWILIALLPFLQIIPIRAFIAERFLYIPLMGLAAAAAWLCSRRRAGRWIVYGWILFLAGVTFKTVPSWKNEERLWQYAVRQDPANPFAQVCYAESLANRAEAEDHYRLALTLEPPPSIRLAAMNNLASLYLQDGQFWKAHYWAQKVVRQDPSNPFALYTLKASGLHDHLETKN